MSEIFCDIVPQPAGWAFVSKGVQSPTYPCCQMAIEAALRHASEEASARRFPVLRQQDLRGRMRRIARDADANLPEEDAPVAAH